MIMIRVVALILAITLALIVGNKISAKYGPKIPEPDINQISQNVYFVPDDLAPSFVNDEYIAPSQSATTKLYFRVLPEEE